MKWGSCLFWNPPSRWIPGDRKWTPFSAKRLADTLWRTDLKKLRNWPCPKIKHHVWNPFSLFSRTMTHGFLLLFHACKAIFIRGEKPMSKIIVRNIFGHVPSFAFSETLSKWMSSLPYLQCSDRVLVTPFEKTPVQSTGPTITSWHNVLTIEDGSNTSISKICRWTSKNIFP